MTSIFYPYKKTEQNKDWRWFWHWIKSPSISEAATFMENSCARSISRICIRFSHTVFFVRRSSWYSRSRKINDDFAVKPLSIIEPFFFNVCVECNQIFNICVKGFWLSLKILTERHLRSKTKNHDLNMYYKS